MRKSTSWWIMGGITLAAPFLIFACGEEPKREQAPPPAEAASEHKHGGGMEMGSPAAKQPVPGETKAQPAATNSPAGKEQTTCPVMGGKIDKTVYFDHAGKRVYFCCAGCPAQFKEDPEKYVKKMEDEGIVLEKVTIGNP